MTPLFRETVTLLNRLAAEDGDGLDAWKKTVLTGCVFVKTTVRSVSGSDVSLGQTVTVRIPESPDYHPSGMERQHERIYGFRWRHCGAWQSGGDCDAG